MYANAQLRYDLRMQRYDPDMLEHMSSYIKKLMIQHSKFEISGFASFCYPYFRLNSSVERKLYLRTASNVELIDCRVFANPYAAVSAAIFAALGRFYSVNIEFKGVGKLAVMQYTKFYYFLYNQHEDLSGSRYIHTVVVPGSPHQAYDPATIFWNQKLATPSANAERRALSAQTKRYPLNIVELESEEAFSYVYRGRSVNPRFRVRCSGVPSKISTLRTLQQCDVPFEAVRAAVYEYIFGRLKSSIYTYQSQQREASRVYPRAKEICCKCYWENDIKEKAQQRRSAVLIADNLDYFSSLHSSNDERMARFARNFNEAYSKNSERATLYATNKAYYRRYGHYYPEGSICSNKAILEDSPEAMQARRAASVDTMRYYVSQAYKDEERRRGNAERTEDYINRKQLEMDVMNEEQQLRNAYLQRRRYLRLIAEYDVNSCTLGEIQHRRDAGTHLTGLFNANDKTAHRFKDDETMCKFQNYECRNEIRAKSEASRAIEKMEEQRRLAFLQREQYLDYEMTVAAHKARSAELYRQMEASAQKQYQRKAELAHEKRVALDGFRFNPRNVCYTQPCEYH